MQFVLSIFVFLSITGGLMVEAACPSSSVVSPCSCVDDSSRGMNITCRGSYLQSGEQLRTILANVSSYGNIYSLSLSYVNFYIPDDVLASTAIPQVYISCNPNDVNEMLQFSSRAFHSADGECTLSDTLRMENCVLREFDANVLSNCYNLKTLSFFRSYVERIIRFPMLPGLTNFTVFSRTWSGAPQQGLSEIEITGELMPNLQYLDLTGNSLEDDDLTFLTPLFNLRTLHLEGNNFSAIPDLSPFPFLTNFSMFLNKENPNITLSLPAKGAASSVEIAIISKNNYTSLLPGALRGNFNHVNLTLHFRMETFDRSVFYEPLEQMVNGSLNLKSDPLSSHFQCICDISWLIRDHPSLLSRVKNGYCKNGRRFEELTTDEYACCASTEPLLRRIRELEMEVEQWRISSKMVL